MAPEVAVILRFCAHKYPYKLEVWVRKCPENGRFLQQGLVSGKQKWKGMDGQGETWLGPADMKKGGVARKSLVSARAMGNAKCCNIEHSWNSYVAGGSVTLVQSLWKKRATSTKAEHPASNLSVPLICLYLTDICSPTDLYWNHPDAHPQWIPAWWTW